MSDSDYDYESDTFYDDSDTQVDIFYLSLSFAFANIHYRVRSLRTLDQLTVSLLIFQDSTIVTMRQSTRSMHVSDGNKTGTATKATSGTKSSGSL